MAVIVHTYTAVTASKVAIVTATVETLTASYR
jgi:hypothetical protein